MATVPPLTLHWVYNLEKAPSSTNAGRVIALACAFSSIAFLAVVVRFAVRWRLVRTGAGLDDSSVAASAVRLNRTLSYASRISDSEISTAAWNCV